jgi:hypothetical protein
MTLTKGGLLIELSSDDVYFVSKQMEKWCRAIYGNLPMPVLPAPIPPRAPSPPPPPTPVMEPARPPVSTVDLPFAPMPEAPALEVEQPPAALIVDEPLSPSPEPAQMPAAVVSPVAPPPVAVPGPPSDIEDDFEAVMDSLMEDLGRTGAAVAEVVEEPQPSLPPVVKAVPATAPPPPAQAPAASPAPMEINSLSDLVRRAQATTPEEFLMLASYFLTFFEAEERFSLKRINSMMVRSGITPVNHSVLESTLAKEYLAMVPDLTGMADVTEYTLTSAGQEFTERLL